MVPIPLSPLARFQIPVVQDTFSIARTLIHSRATIWYNGILYTMIPNETFADYSALPENISSKS